MDWTSLLLFNIAALVAIASPGPALLYAMGSTLQGGFTSGFMAGLGLALIAASWVAMALLGLHVVFEIFPWAYIFLKTMGAIYLIYIAFRTWKNANTPLAQTKRKKTNAFLGGVLVNLSNPKSVLFAGAVLIVIFPSELNSLEKAIITANLFLIEISVYTTLALVLSRKVVIDQYLRAKPASDRIFATVLGYLGLRLLISR